MAKKYKRNQAGGAMLAVTETGYSAPYEKNLWGGRERRKKVQEKK